MEWQQILRHLRQLFSPEYRWSIYGGSDCYVLHLSKGHCTVKIDIDREIIKSDIYFVGNRLLDKLSKG